MTTRAGSFGMHLMGVIVMRFVSRNMEHKQGLHHYSARFESDKFDKKALTIIDYFIGTLKPDFQTGIKGGLKRLHMDSWEMGAQLELEL